MKNIFRSLSIATLALSVAAVIAQTNAPSTNALPRITIDPIVLSTNSVPSGKEYGGWELTLGGAGETVNGESSFGLSVSLETNPFKSRPEVWLGVSQEVNWTPSFSGSTDLFADWAWKVYKDTVFLNTGWSVGSVYDNESTVWRTGPEVSLQWYTSDNAFIYAGVNYDIVNKGDNGFRYSFGIGLAF